MATLKSVYRRLLQVALKMPDRHRSRMVAWRARCVASRSALILSLTFSLRRDADIVLGLFQKAPDRTAEAERRLIDLDILADNLQVRYQCAVICIYARNVSCVAIKDSSRTLANAGADAGLYSSRSARRATRTAKSDQAKTRRHPQGRRKCRGCRQESFYERSRTVLEIVGVSKADLTFRIGMRTVVHLTYFCAARSGDRMMRNLPFGWVRCDEYHSLL